MSALSADARRRLGDRLRPLRVPLLAALFVAAPFLTSRALGTSEAANYSLAVADFVTQVRAGELPVLVGQSEFAWNGRIHPLRTAPYLLHLAAALDLVTFRSLGFWTLQNLVVGLSLAAGILAFHACVRRAAPSLDPTTAAWFAAAYGLAPGLLATAYSMDLYMTVMTAPWIPVALGGLAVAWRDAGERGHLQAAVAVAACWLAHPPVAFWLTLVVGAGFLCVLLRGPRRGAISLRLASAAALFAILAAFAFASALTTSSYGSVTNAIDRSLLLAETKRVYADALRPVSATADRLGDFQLGYAYWAALAAAAFLAVRQRHGLGGFLVAAAIGLLVLTLPVPGIHAWLWNHAPDTAIHLTNQWPMQRLYLLASAGLLFALALVWRPVPAPRSRVLRELRTVLILAVLGWTAWEALRFVSRGFRTQVGAAATARAHLPENVNLSIISFALLGAPPWFAGAFMEPAMEFRLRAPFDARTVLVNGATGFPTLVTRGTFRRATSGPGAIVLGPKLRLEPGLRYRLTFDFRSPPREMVLRIAGSRLFHEYPLPAAGGPQAFGMNPGQSRSVYLRTTGTAAEEVELTLFAPGIEGQASAPFAEFTLESGTLEDAAVNVSSLHPIAARVRAPSAGYLEAPRLFLEGYEASVGGQPVDVQRSPDGLILIPVPAGESQVEIRHAGPRVVRATFWLAAAGWLSVGLLAVAGPSRRTRLGTALAARGAVAWKRGRWRILGGLVVLGVGVAGIRSWRDSREAVGPMVLRVLFPRDQPQGVQPLLVAGEPLKGIFVYVRYEDSRHIRIGYDIWGVRGEVSDPIETDYFAAHTIEIHASALYPDRHPAVRSLAPDARERLRQDFRVLLDGGVVFDRTSEQWESRPRDVTVGANRIGGSTAGTAFTGRILEVRRLPVAPSAPRPE